MQQVNQALVRKFVNKEEPTSVKFCGYNNGESSVDLETKKLMQVKKLLDAYPMEISEEAAREINLENVLSNVDFIQKLPIYIKLVDFTNPV